MALITLEDLDQWTLAAGVELSGSKLQLEPQVTPGIKLQLDLNTEDTDVYAVDGSGNHASKNILFRNDAEVDSAQKKFGVGSLLLPSVDDAIDVRDGLDDFKINGDITIHFFIRYIEAPFAALRIVAGLGGGAGAWNNTDGHSWNFRTTTTDYGFFYYTGTPGTPSSFLAAKDGALVINTWTHIAIVNDTGNSTFRVYVGGVKKINETNISVTATSSLLGFLVGGIYNGGAAVAFAPNANYDAVYVVPGQVLFTDDFIPPTRPEGGFLDTNPTATMGQIAVAENIGQIPIAESNESGSSITWDYNIGAGFVTGNTLAQLKAALIGTSPATLDLRANFISDGEGQPSFNYNGQAIADTDAAGGGGTRSRFARPLGVKERVAA